MAGFPSFQMYLNVFPGSSYYVFYNMGDPKSPYQIHLESNQYMDKNDKRIDDGMEIKLIKFLLNKGLLNEEQIPIYLKTKIGIKLNNSEKNGLKEIDTFLKNYVDGSNIDLNDRKIKNTQFNSILDIKIGHPMDNLITIDLPILLLFESGIKYYPGFGDYSVNKFTELLNKKYPDFNFNHFDWEVERNMNWGNPNVNILKKYVDDKRFKIIKRDLSNKKYETLMNDDKTNKILDGINNYLTKNFGNLKIVNDGDRKIFERNNDKIFMLRHSINDFTNNFTTYFLSDFDTCHKYIEDVLPTELKHNHDTLTAIYRRFILDNYNMDFDNFSYEKLNR
jgi:hypothetical protein